MLAPALIRYFHSSEGAWNVGVFDFDIFKIEIGEYVLLEAADSLDAATERFETLQKETPADYMIHSHRTGKRIVFTAPGWDKARLTYCPHQSVLAVVLAAVVV